MLEEVLQRSVDDFSDEAEASAYYASYELQNGRIEWLGEHIRRSNFQISSLVARKILALIEPGNDECFFELKLVRRSDLAPAEQNPFTQRVRDLEMAVEVAKRGGFDRSQNKRVCHIVGELPEYGLAGSTVSKRVRPFRETALGIVREQAMALDYQEGKVDYLGRPNRP